MSEYRLRQDDTGQIVNEYSVLWLTGRAFDAAPTLSLFTESARMGMAGIVQRALTVQEEGAPFTLKPHLEDAGTAWYLVEKEFRADTALGMLNDKALRGLVQIAIDALYEKVDA